jgi:hypothetical protein
MLSEDDCKYYTVEEMALATVRFYEVRQSKKHSLWDWLGCNWASCFNIESHQVRAYMIPVPCCSKMDLLLSPHYLTLYKAWRIKHEG